MEVIEKKRRSLLKVKVNNNSLLSSYEHQTFDNNFAGCMPGYQGINCTMLCPYPQYGIDCQRSCNCNRDLCNVSTGCIDPTTGKQKQKQNIKARRD